MKISQYRSKISAALLLSTLLSGAVFGQTREITLQEAIDLSLDHSNALKISESQIAEASAIVQEARNSRLPDLDISGQYLRVNKPNLEIKIGGEQDDSDQEAEQGGGMPNVNQAMMGMASASLPIFAGGRISSGIASARYLEKAAKLDAQKDQLQVIQNTVAAYFNLYKAKAAVRVVSENLRSSQQRVKDFSNMEANGLLARNDLLKVQLQESNLELALLTAENDQKVANFNFNLMLGLPEDTQLVLDSTVEVSLSLEGSLQEWEGKALEQRADQKALEQRQLASHASVQAAKGDYFPSLALTAGYVGIYVPHALTVTNAMNVGVGLSYNLASLYKAGAHVKQAKAKEEALHWNQEQLRDNIKVAIHKAYQDLNQSREKIAVSEKALEQAVENYRITKNKYDNSLATTTDLLDADVARLQTQIDYEYAKADAMIAYYKLHEQAGVKVVSDTGK